MNRGHGESLVLVVGPVPPPIHGAARVTGLVIENLTEAGAPPLVVNTSGTESGVGMVHHVFRTFAHLRAIALLARHRRHLSAVYVAGEGGLGLWYQLTVMAAARLLGVAATFHHHSYAYLHRRLSVMRLLTAVGGPRCEHVTLCTGMADALRRRYPKVRRVRVCSNAGLFAAADPSVTQPHEGPVVLGHLGNLVVEKGLPHVLAGLRRVRADGVDARLLLGGPVRSAEAEHLLAAAQEEFGPAIEHVGAVPPDAVDAFYRRLDLFLFPSTFVHEAEPLVILEAARCGVPAVAFAVGCVGALVPDPDRLVSEGEDFAAAAARAAAALVDPDARAAARQAAAREFAARRAAALGDHHDMVRALLTRAAPRGVRA